MIRSVCLTRNKINTIARITSKRYQAVAAEVQSKIVPKDGQAVARWLFLVGPMAGTIAVVLGGVTRLTESGLSMTSWHLIKDITKPTTEEEWRREFERYKTFPEYEDVHSELTLEGFKFIYHMEWGHRNWGRSIGAMFILPFAYFGLRGRLSQKTMKRCLGISAILGFQGWMGWYMVKSGLTKNPELYGQTRVSPYRLCAHLSTALVYITACLWTAMDIRVKNTGAPALPDHRLIAVLRKKSVAMAAFTFFTAMTGAFVAGNDAGLIYNTYPLMGDRFFPSDYFNPYMGKLQNFFENHATVQFNHRLLAHLLVLGVGASWMMSRKAGLTGSPMIAANAMMAAVSLQATLGIMTILYNVPVALGAAHQFGSVALLTSTLVFAHQIKRGKINSNLARKILTK